MIFIWGSGQDGVVAAGMETEDDLGSWGTFEAHALGANGNPAIGGDLERGSETPNIGPPGTTRGWPQDGTVFLFREIPGALRGQAQFPVRLVDVAVEPQRIDVPVGLLQFGDLFTGEKGGEALLPELMFPFDFAFGLGRGSVTKTNAIKLERPAQLRQRVRELRGKDGMIIDIELQRSAVVQEGARQEIEVGQEQFALINLGADKEAAAVVEHIEHGKIAGGEREPTVRRGIQLPEFADLGTLPAPHRGRRLLGGQGMGIIVLPGPVADLGAVELELAQAPDFRGHEAIGARWGAGQAFDEQINDRLRPDGSVVTTGAARDPKRCLVLRAAPEIFRGDHIKAAAGKAELVGGGAGRERALLERFEHMTNEGGTMPVEQLLILFIHGD